MGYAGKDTPFYEYMQELWRQELDAELAEQDELREAIREEQNDYSDFV